MNKASGIDGMPTELFQVLKDDAVKVLHSPCLQTWKTQQWPQDWKRSVFIPIPKKGNAKEFSKFRAIAFISHTSKAWSKSLKLGFSSMNQELPDVHAEFRKSRGTRDKLPTSAGSSKKQESSRKTSTSALLDTTKPLIVWITINWKILQEMRVPDHLTCLLWNLHASQEATVRMDMEPWTGSKLEMKYVKAVYCHPAYLTYMQTTSCEMPGWMKHKLESRFLGEISVTSDMQMTLPLWQKSERN